LAVPKELAHGAEVAVFRAGRQRLTESVAQRIKTLREVPDAHAIDRGDVRRTQLARPRGGFRDRRMLGLEPAPGLERTAAHVIAAG
jgi:hypothetical protein